MYPSLLELEDIHTWVLESTRCRLTLCSVQASPSRHFCEGRVDCQMIAQASARSFTRISPLVHRLPHLGSLQGQWRARP